MDLVARLPLDRLVALDFAFMALLATAGWSMLVPEL
jgi:hypothetical protein